MQPTFFRLAVILLLAGLPAFAGPQADPPLNFAVTSWGDIAYVHGPGTYPSMSSPEMLEKMMQHWRDRGYTGVTMRTDLVQFEPFIRRNPIPDNDEMAQSSGISNPRVASLLHYIDTLMESFDAHEMGSELGPKIDFEWWAWHPHVYSDGAPETVGEPGVGRIWPWSYVYKYEFEHPEVVTIDRDGAKLWMVPEYGYPGLREEKVADVVYMAKTFGIKNFLLCMRSEVNQLIDPPADADQYGFNDVTVRDMKRLYGVDILTDPRFDYKSPKFDRNDEMVNKWRDLRGDYVTAYYREVRQALRELDPQIRFGVTLSGDHVGPPLGNWRLDWRTWVDEGLIDDIFTPIFFEGTLDHDAGKKGYLTNVREGKGIVSTQQLGDYIAKSAHPEIRVIHSGGSPYLFRTPPAGADGWRTDIWYSSYTLAWYQRWWQHWMKDVDELGRIAFFKQDFDDFPIGDSGRARGWGDGRYDPELRYCPGVWYTLGDGSDARPHTVEDVAHGDSGRAIKLTRAADGRSNLTAWHNANPDRSNMVNGLDTSITNGRADFSFWVYRPKDGGGVSAYIQETGAEMDAGLHVAPGSGRVCYSKGRQADHGDWVETDYVVPTEQWTKLSMVIDLDRMVYSIFAGDENPTQLSRDIPLEAPKKRYTSLNGVNLPIEVPAMKSYKLLLFVPEGQPDSSIYLDDVGVDWTPTLHYARPGTAVEVSDDFETQDVDRPIHKRATPDGSRWIVESDHPERWTVTNDTSFGEGVRAVLAGSDGRMVARTRGLMKYDADTVWTLDLDLFIRSNSVFPYIIPNPETRSAQQVTVGVERRRDETVLAAARSGEASWELLDANGPTPSQTGIAFDVWNHLQLTLDPAQGEYRLVVQPLGEVPTLVGSGRLPDDLVDGEPLRLFIQTQHMGELVSLFDNIRLCRDGDASPR